MSTLTHLLHYCICLGGQMQMITKNSQSVPIMQGNVCLCLFFHSTKVQYWVCFGRSVKWYKSKNINKYLTCLIRLANLQKLHKIFSKLLNIKDASIVHLPMEWEIHILIDRWGPLWQSASSSYQGDFFVEMTSPHFVWRVSPLLLSFLIFCTDIVRKTKKILKQSCKDLVYFGRTIDWLMSLFWQNYQVIDYWTRYNKQKSVEHFVIVLHIIVYNRKFRKFKFWT